MACVFSSWKLVLIMRSACAYLQAGWLVGEGQGKAEVHERLKAHGALLALATLYRAPQHALGGIM